MILQQMTCYAREINQPHRAADLYFAEFVDLTLEHPQFGTFLKSHPLSLTARGL